MVSISQIVTDINDTRKRTSQTFEVLSQISNKKFDFHNYIKENPIAVALMMFLAGLFLVFFSKKITIKLFQFGFGTLKAAIFGYLSKKTVTMLMKRFKY